MRQQESNEQLASQPAAAAPATLSFISTDYFLRNARRKQNQKIN